MRRLLHKFSNAFKKQQIPQTINTPDDMRNFITNPVVEKIIYSFAKKLDEYRLRKDWNPFVETYILAVFMGVALYSRAGKESTTFLAFFTNMILGVIATLMQADGKELLAVFRKTLETLSEGQTYNFYR